ncbi:unnamed protein product [Clavelina lepadiformis]|uniref:Fucosyltransferase n=1 Tax=Clavelina lepadiformis TaxID=159417 RepID=A0ABP0FJ40_CLALP
MHYYKKSLDDFDGYFNVTMHYRSDADITASFIPHTARDWYLHKVGRKAESTLEELPLVTSEEEFERMFDELMKVKSGATSWVASDCNDVAGATKRLQLVNEIEKKGNYVIDRYGRCGIREIPLNGSILYDLLRTYRFYLAFENAQSCKDYISEKFWYNALYTGAVPIVWGPTKADVERVAPPNSFIHVDDFDGDWTRLANYLRSLEADVDAYKEYFRWWTMKGFFPIYKLRQPDDVRDIVTDNACHFETNGMCHLCKTLNENRHKKSYKVVRSLSDHFYGPEIFRCFKPNIC